MTATVRAFLLMAGMALAAAPLRADDDPNQQIRDILKAVKQRAEAGRNENERKALNLLDQAALAHHQGKLREAAELSQKAIALLPSSPEVKAAVKRYHAADRRARELQVNRAVAKARLDEALEQAETYVSEHRPNKARDLIQAVLVVLERHPELKSPAARRAAERLMDLTGSDVVATPFREDREDGEQLAVPPRPIGRTAADAKAAVPGNDRKPVPEKPDATFRLSHYAYPPPPAMYPARPAAVARPRSPEPEASRLPEYLLSGKALLAHLEELLGTSEHLLPP